MTIKQQGGVFGRNPTFNEVTVDGTLTVDQIVEKTGATGITLDGVTLKDGNVVLADGKGIDFSATAGTGTSELFDDYEEGTWTPVQGAGLSVVGTFTSNGSYTKIGRAVTISGTVNGSTSVSIGGIAEICSGLPFAVSATGGAIGSVGGSPSAAISTCFTAGTSVYTYAGVGPTTTIAFSATYFV